MNSSTYTLNDTPYKTDRRAEQHSGDWVKIGDPREEKRQRQRWTSLLDARSNVNYISLIYNQSMDRPIVSETIVPPLNFLDPISEMFNAGNKAQKEFVLEVYRVFADYFTRHADFKGSYFVFRTFVFDENCIVIEWVFPDIIFSLNIEEEIEGSSWSLLSSSAAGDLALGDTVDKKGSIQNIIISAINQIQNQRTYARK